MGYLDPAVTKPLQTYLYLIWKWAVVTVVPVLAQFTNPRMTLFHIPQCSIQNRNVHISVLNATLRIWIRCILGFVKLVNLLYWWGSSALRLVQPEVEQSNRECHWGGHYSDYYPGALPLSQVIATLWKSGTQSWKGCLTKCLTEKDHSRLPSN